MIVTFCGHRDIADQTSVSAWLRTILCDLLASGADTFYLGGYGQFDELAATMLREQMTIHPGVNLVLVIPYLDAKTDRIGYTETIYPPLENVPPRYAISRRNRWMIEQADTVVAYVLHDWGGAAKTLEYARRKHKRIIQYQGYDTDSPPTHVFFYDYSSLETMLIATNETFEKTLDSLYPSIKKHDDIYNKLFHGLETISAARKIDAQYQYNLNFKAISITKIYDTRSQQLSIEKMFACLIKSNDHFFKDPERCKSFCMKVRAETQREKSNEQLVTDTRGHDCLAMLHCLCKPLKGKDMYGEEAILASLVCAHKFSLSQLYIDLKEYSRRIDIQIVVS